MEVHLSTAPSIGAANEGEGATARGRGAEEVDDARACVTPLVALRMKMPLPAVEVSRNSTRPPRVRGIQQLWRR